MTIPQCDKEHVHHLDGNKECTTELFGDRGTPLSMTHANHEELVDMIKDLHRKVDAIVEIVQNTVDSLGNNPMMQMLSKLAPKAKG